MVESGDIKKTNLDVIYRIVKFINNNPKSKIIFMVGAGISTSCGIPDFRSPKTGLYHNLSKLNLPYAEAVFDIDFFKENPKPFYTLAQELYPGKFKPSKFHFLMKLFEEKGHLQRIYTQNIDTLERQAGINPKYIIEAHGSFAANHCTKCNKHFKMEYFKSKLSTKKITDGGVEFDYAKCDECQGLVKPNIVFFGENLPKRFFNTWDQDLEKLESQSDSSKSDDYMIVVAGTSLEVYPFASLPIEVPGTVSRCLINLDIVGDFKDNPRDKDLVFQGTCDKASQLIVSKLGWEEDLKKIYENFEIETITLNTEMSKIVSEMKNLQLCEIDFDKTNILDNKQEEKKEKT
ncbi:histone deacetylase HST2 PWA37_001203 [Arxiozyma heterogenica]|uniref:histone deacetylase HST2 n=1 Tax=Arxiozyma heterogenica TaxID=278026 RepID=UPI002F174314